MNDVLKNISGALIFIFTLVLFQPSAAQTTNDTNGNLVDEVIQQLVLNKKINEWPEDLSKQFRQNPFGLPAEKNNTLLDALNNAYQKELLVNDLRNSLSANLSGEYQKIISDWLAKSSTKKVNKAQQAFYTLQGQRKRIVAMYEMEQSPAPANKNKLLQTFLDTTLVVERNVEMGSITFRSIIEGLNQLSTQRQLSEDQMNTIVDNFKRQQTLQAPQSLKKQLLVTYYDIPNSTLQSYVSFFTTEAGQQLDSAIDQSIKQAYKAAAKRFTASLNTDK